MTSPDQPSRPDGLAYRIERLTKVYGQGEAAVHALRGVDLELPEGEIVVLLGPSGSGKSTLLNIIGGLDRGTDGVVWFRDRNLTEMGDAELTRYRRDNVGFVFQFYNLMPSLTAHENVELVTEIAEDPIHPDEALALVGLHERTGHFPAQLSGGEQQRVAIARAVAKRPKVLFCDEPTGALDSKTGRAVLRVLKDVNETLGSTVLIVTHAAATAAMAFLPSLALTGSAGTSSTELSHLFDPDVFIWSVAGRLLQPIFQGGRLRAQVEFRAGERDQALQTYADTVLTALSEVETALAVEEFLAGQERELEEALAAAERASTISRNRYDVGKESRLPLLDSQKRALDARSRLLAVRRARLANRVDLHLALGGGFEDGGQQNTAHPRGSGDLGLSSEVLQFKPSSPLPRG